MTTPERLRRRQRLESAGIAVLAAMLVAATIWFNGQQNAQQECLSTYISLNSKTQKIRSELLARESQTTRRFLLDATNPEAVKTRADFKRVRATYARSLRAIDEARRDNPIPPFPKGVCD